LHKDEGWIGELVALRKDGSTFDAQLSASPVKDKAGKIIGTMAAIIDITRQKRLQKVQNAIYSISEKASSAQNLDELYKDIHKIVNRLMPAENFYIALYDEKDDSISFPFFVDEYDDLPPPMKLGKTMTAYVLRTGKPKLASAKDCEELEKRGEAERFGTLPLYWLGVPLKTTGNKTIGVLVVQIYEQGRKYTEEDKGMLGFVSTQIARAIERKREEQRKEVLQREIHHRVKNNFNFIYSLLDMQSRQIEDQRVKEIFEFTQDRIMLMAMVHEKLYQSENLSEIDFARFVKDLSDSLIRSYSIEENRVSLILNVKNVSLGIDKAIPCGLIINELVTNSLKYAFPLYHENEDHSENKIVIGLHPEGENTMVLRVMDNGVGLPENIDFFDTSTLGLRLVRLLSKQIHGEIDLNREVGTDVSVTFEV